MAWVPIVLGAVGTYGSIAYGGARAVGSIMGAITPKINIPGSKDAEAAAKAMDAQAGMTAVEALAKKRRTQLRAGGQTIFSNLAGSLLGGGSAGGTGAKTLLGQ